MESELDLIPRLRMRVVRGLHLGRLRTGDRLPSIREIEREFGINARIVARAYHALEVEGLVEVRGRSGVYVAQQDQLSTKILPVNGIPEHENGYRQVEARDAVLLVFRAAVPSSTSQLPEREEMFGTPVFVQCCCDCLDPDGALGSGVGAVTTSCGESRIEPVIHL